MADKKISELPSAVVTTPDDLLLIIDNPTESPTSKNITIEAFFSKIPVEVEFLEEVLAASLSVEKFTLLEETTPANSDDVSAMDGNLAFDDDYLYLKVGDKIKRVALEEF